MVWPHKSKLSSDLGFIIIKANRAFQKEIRKVPQKHFRNYYCLDGHLGIDDWDFIFFGKCETHNLLIYPLGLIEKEGLLY